MEIRIYWTYFDKYGHDSNEGSYYEFRGHILYIGHIFHISNEQSISEPSLDDHLLQLCLQLFGKQPPVFLAQFQNVNFRLESRRILLERSNFGIFLGKCGNVRFARTLQTCRLCIKRCNRGSESLFVKSCLEIKYEF